MNRRLSIGAQWTLRYTLALLVTVSIFGFYTYSEISRRTARDAELVLDPQVREVAEAMRAAAGGRTPILEAIEQDISAAPKDLKLGFAVFDAQGVRLFGRGSLEIYETILPEEVFSGLAEKVTAEMEVGENYPYLVTSSAAGEGFVQGALYMRPFVRNARDVRDIYLFSLPVLLLVTAGLGYLLARGSLRPLKEMNRTARRISGTHLDELIPKTGSGDELDELAETLNEMIARIARGVERMRRFSGNAAHELRTPLNALRSRLEVTLGQPRDAEEMRTALLATVEEVEGLAKVIHSMMRLAQSEAGLSPDQKTPVDLTSLLAEVTEFFEPLAVDAEVTIHAMLDDPVEIAGDPTWLHELFANLLDNAIKYSPDGGLVEVDIRRVGGSVLVSIRDQGVGISDQDLPRIFQPFHRVGNRSEAPGVGLGLPIAREIARAHSGELTVESTLGKGTSFTVRLPAQ